MFLPETSVSYSLHFIPFYFTKKREICGKLSILVLHKNEEVYIIRVRMWYTLSHYLNIYTITREDMSYIVIRKYVQHASRYAHYLNDYKIIILFI